MAECDNAVIETSGCGNRWTLFYRFAFATLFVDSYWKSDPIISEKHCCHLSRHFQSDRENSDDSLFDQRLTLKCDGIYTCEEM
ncbi:hypothetical protein T10_6492 [Trichinella papuae]|uniref:Uncharacterized protein n=1 Tax=Trichinella papuae TaxID=268474 RepID=A0A0V1MP23_9BILA|nr:hypothetical protein T10_6492 [Trichinella papuae]